MHTEHLQNVRPAGVLFGWFVSVAVVSLIAVGLAALGLEPESGTGSGLLGAAAIAVGFGVGGWILGQRLGVAPILHGVAMGVVSILVWFAANLLAGETVADSAWVTGSEAYYAGLLLLQMVAAGVGASIGSRAKRRAVV
ncbi:hypothetical protein [Longimicrobium sp.]|uniref:hypothetical protein n=1 Tax=Longimicrobium sp. TaxID=2029185 RepID=UPI002E324214|nr:hypothetical protein [Longimicrobium sp.]HEX6041861.1 hypothetical protein [Longimicrobium sp.]